MSVPASESFLHGPPTGHVSRACWTRPLTNDPVVGPDCNSTLLTQHSHLARIPQTDAACSQRCSVMLGDRSGAAFQRKPNLSPRSHPRRPSLGDGSHPNFVHAFGAGPFLRPH